MRIAEALRLLRTREGLTQTRASKLNGAPDFRTLSHWETKRKMPSLKLLSKYLASLGLDFHDLQEALDQIEGKAPKPVRHAMAELTSLVASHEVRLRCLEAANHETSLQVLETSNGADE